MELPSTKAMQYHGDFLLREPDIRPKGLLLWLGESLTALLALEPLNLVLSVKNRPSPSLSGNCGMSSVKSP